MDDEDQLFDHSSSNHPAYPFDLVNADSPASTNSTVDASEVTIPKKKGRKGKVKELPFNWKDDLVYFLIDKWQEEELLYKVDDANYHDKMKRNLALVRIITQIEDTTTRSSSLTSITHEGSERMSDVTRKQIHPKRMNEVQKKTVNLSL